MSEEQEIDSKNEELAEDNQEEEEGQ